MEISSLRLSLRDELGRPKLTLALINSLLDAVQFAPSLCLVTLEGERDAFCEGLDLDLLARGDREECEAALARYADLLQAIDHAPRPVVALVDGRTLGGGVGLVAAADLVIASERASFALPEVLLGVIPAMVFPIIARRVGVARARLLALGGQPLSADRALQWGLVDEVSDDLEQSLSRQVSRLAKMDARAVGAMKSLIASHFSSTDRFGEGGASAGLRTPTMSESYRQDAVTRFGALVSGDRARARLARFIQGDPPWLDESVA